MKFFQFSFLLIALVAVTANAGNDVNGNSDRREININQSDIPRLPHVAEPEAYYTTTTATLSIELDPVEYSEFTIILSTAYACIDYVATSATVNIPVGALDDVIEIYIESDDCGCYYGVLDQSAYSNTY